MNGPIGAATPLVRKPVEVVLNLDLDLKQQMKLMVVVVLAQIQWQEIATPKTVQVSIFSCFWIFSLSKDLICKIIYWLGRWSFILSFIISKNLRGCVLNFQLGYKITNLLFFWHNKTQKERVSTNASKVCFSKELGWGIWANLIF